MFEKVKVLAFIWFDSPIVFFKMMSQVILPGWWRWGLVSWLRGWGRVVEVGINILLKIKKNNSFTTECCYHSVSGDS